MLNDEMDFLIRRDETKQVTLKSMREKMLTSNLAELVRTGQGYSHTLIYATDVVLWAYLHVTFFPPKSNYI